MRSSVRAAAALVAAAVAAPACGLFERTGSPVVDGPRSPQPSASTPAPAPASPPSPSASGSPSPSAPLRPVTDAYPTQRLRWSGCGDGFECATLKVPLDYADLRGRTIDVSVIRLPASGSRSGRIGSIVVNPGGPGGSGVDFARQARSLFQRDVRTRFDVVGFDPRGVGRSTPVRCVESPRELDRILHADPDPETSAEKRQLVDVSREQAEGCKRRFGWLLPHITTINTARDLEVLRRALGDPKLTYLGFSYGTVLGGLYAEQFPGRVRALVLDGAVDVSLDESEIGLQQALGFEQALDAFLDWCTDAPGCAFRSKGPNLERRLDDLLASIERSTLPGSGSRRVGPSEAKFGIAAALYTREYGWPALGTALRDAVDGSGAGLLRLFDQLVDRRSDGTYSNSVEALVAISCVDGEYSRDVASYDAEATRFARRAPIFGAAVAYGGLACAFWPRPAAARGGPISAPGTPPILVVGTTRDPATPYAWSQALARQLPRGVLLTYDGDGHTAYGYGRSSCVDRHVNDYLLTLKTPPAGTRC